MDNKIIVYEARGKFKFQGRKQFKGHLCSGSASGGSLGRKKTTFGLLSAWRSHLVAGFENVLKSVYKKQRESVMEQYLVARLPIRSTS